MIEQRKWFRLSVVGVAALLGAPTDVAALGVDRIFGHLDAVRKSRARKLSSRAESVLTNLARHADPGAIESARRTTEELLARFGLTDERFAMLDLNAKQAADAVLDHGRFTSDEQIELKPLCRELLISFYECLPEDPDLLAELLPHIHRESLRRLGRLETKQDRAQETLDALLAKVSAEKGVPLPVLQEILAKLGDHGVPSDAARIEERLHAKADEYRDLTARLRRLTNDDPRVQELHREAAERIADSAFESADARLAEAEARDLEVVEELEEHSRRRRLSAAESRAERGAAARLGFDYHTAADHYAAAVVIVPNDDEMTKWRYQIDQAGALYAQGDEFGDNAALRQAIVGYGLALELAPQSRRPLDWAMTQNNLGNALVRLGESETPRLEEAVTAYRAALEERSRERVPLDWAMTQNNLGVALQTLGERESGAARLKEAVAAYRAALEEWTRERVPLEWAMTQNNLGVALQALGSRERVTAWLKEAVAAHRAALQEFTRERVPLEWATTQNNLGVALQTLGSRERVTARLKEAVAAYRAALEEWTRERVPLQWAMTQNNLGNALQTLGSRERVTARLKEAVAAYRAALQEFTRERRPLRWAWTQENIGLAYYSIAEKTKNQATLIEGIKAIKGALEVFEQDQVTYNLEKARRNLAAAETLLADFGGSGH